MKKTESKILKFLANYKDPETGECTPYQKDIAEDLQISAGYVGKILRRLARRGQIEITPRWEWIDEIDAPDYPIRTRIVSDPNEKGWAGEVGPIRLANLYRVKRVKNVNIIRKRHYVNLRPWLTVSFWAAALPGVPAL